MWNNLFELGVSNTFAIVLRIAITAFTLSISAGLLPPKRPSFWQGVGIISLPIVYGTGEDMVKLSLLIDFLQTGNTHDSKQFFDLVHQIQWLNYYAVSVSAVASLIIWVRHLVSRSAYRASV